MQNYKNEYTNLLNAFKTGMLSHVNTIDRMMNNIDYLEKYFIDVYNDFTEDDIIKKQQSIQNIWYTGKEIQERFSVK